MNEFTASSTERKSDMNFFIRNTFYELQNGEGSDS